MSDGPGIVRIGQIAIPVADLERAVVFYSDVLGLRLLFRALGGQSSGAHERGAAVIRRCGGRLLAECPGAPTLSHEHPARA
jgi:catechol 2,3-dioxygenase-like lactoylglutathione lyase family enzyme